MSTFEVGDRVRDTKWDGTYVGTVNRVDADGDVSVTWDGHFADYQMSPNDVRREGGDR